MCSTFTSLTAALTCGFLAAGLAAGARIGVWATRLTSSSEAVTLCYLTHSVAPTGASTPYSAPSLLDGGRSLALAGAVAAAALSAALALFLLAFAATLLRAALSQGLLPLERCLAAATGAAAAAAAAPRLRAAASHWAASLVPNALGLGSLALGAAAGWAVAQRCPCAGSGSSPGPSAASAACSLAVGAAALGADCCAHFFPAPERSPLDDHVMGYLALPSS